MMEPKGSWKLFNFRQVFLKEAVVPHIHHTNRIQVDVMLRILYSYWAIGLCISVVQECFFPSIKISLCELEVSKCRSALFSGDFLIFIAIYVF
jgi:hypothetical protein